LTGPRRAGAAALLAAGLLAGPPCVAGETAPTHYDRIGIAASATRAVASDLVVADLFSERQGSDQVVVADQVNRAVRWAVGLAKETEGVRVRTLGYRTSPVRRQQALVGWRARQGLRIEGRDPERIARLLGRLQERLSLGGMRYEVSPQARAAAEDALVVEALTAFRARAALVTRELGRDDYRLVRADVSSGGPPPPRPVAFRAATTEQAVTPPALEPGAQELTVTVDGTIELEPVPE